MRDDDTTYTVGELNQRVADALVESFPRPVWVRGEIQQLRRSTNGHTYFQLVEQDGRRANVRGALSVALFKNDRVAVNQSLRETPELKITDGVEVRIRGRVDYWPPAGRLQLVMTGIDPVFSLGRMAADRERVLRVLSTEGILRRNADLELAPVPLRIGLVTSGGSAAYHDFVHELETSPYAFRVAHVDVRVQGPGAWRRMAYGLRQLAELDVDVIAIVRGGGARSDLAAFDAEPLARVITEMPVPVVSGIGHEVDRTIVDAVAHTAAKTPTAAAAVIVTAVDDYCTRLARVAHRLSTRTRGVCAGAGRRVTEVERRVQRGLPTALDRQHELLSRHSRRVRTAARRRVDEAEGTLVERRRELLTSAGRVGRVGDRALDAATARLRALDPRRVLERGYSLTRDADARVVRSPAEVEPGALLVTETAGGLIRSRREPEVSTAPVDRGDTTTGDET